MASSRPSDHVDAELLDDFENLDDARSTRVTDSDSVTQSRLGLVGSLRFAWRQLTSMRTALLLLLLLAFAAIPGSLVPQRSADPNGVRQYIDANPEFARVLEALQVFDTYTSVWFSAIYLLLFVSLIGCVVPRTKHHFIALRSKPPRTPERLERMAGFRAASAPDTSPADAIEAANAVLRAQGYRTVVIPGSRPSVSAERGNLRETGNLVFHGALVGILIAVGVGGGFGYTGQKVVVEGQALSNVLSSYDTFNPGRFFTESALVPYSIGLDSFTTTFEENNVDAYGQPIDYSAKVTTQLPGAAGTPAEIKVNAPLRIAGTAVYLLGNGYAPWITVRDGEGNIAFSQPVAFLPQDSNLTSVGVIKVPDALPEQLGLLGFFYPTQCQRDICGSALTSVHPDLLDPTLTLEVYTGDLGLDNGTSSSAYALDTTNLTQVAGRKADSPGLLLKVGDRIELPNDLGSVELTEVKKFASLDVHRDPAKEWVLIFAILAFAGTITGLFIPRRRLWVRATESSDGTRLEYAGLARGDDPGVDAAVEALARKHAERLGLRLDS